MSSDCGAVAVNTFLVPPGWVGSPAYMDRPLRKIRSPFTGSSGWAMAGKLKLVSPPVGFHSEGTTPSGTNTVRKFSGAAARAGRARIMNGSCRMAPLAMACPRKLRRWNRVIGCPRRAPGRTSASTLR
jgi:hypothetical protein